MLPMKMRHSLWVIYLAGIVACGGGSGGTGGGANNPPTNTIDPGDGDGGGSVSTPFFGDRTSALGLSYSITHEEMSVSEIFQLGGGMTLDDIDNDGLMELYVSHGRNERGRLFTYNGEQFTQLANNNGIEPFDLDRAGYFIDLDADGWKDFVSVQIESIEVFMNDQTGHFVEATSSSNIFHDRSTFSLAAADYDVDGDIDLFFGHWGATWRLDEALTQYLWQNDGSGFFTDVTDQVAISDEESSPGMAAENSFTPTFADIDSDGYPDMLLVSDFASTQVLRNESGQAFVDATTTVISDENGMGSAVGDYDRDGDLDWFVSSINDGDDSDEDDTGNRLYRNVDGLGNFEDVTDEAGVRDGYWGWGSCFADFDNDGYLDLFHTNGVEDFDDRYSDDPSRLFMSNRDGTFTERSESAGISHVGQGRGVACVDYNNDGKLDIFIANNGTGPTVYENESDNANHYLMIDLTGTGKNPDAIGARVTVSSASGSQIQEVQLGTGYLSQGPQRLHFGLGVDDEISTIEVSWPGPERATSQVENVAADQVLEMEHP